MGLFKKCKGVNPNYTDAMMILHSDNKILVNRNDKLDHELDCARFSIQILEYKLKKLEDSKKVDAAKSVNKLTEADSVICNLKKKVAWLENQLAEKEPKPKNEIISTGRKITIRIPCEKNQDPNSFEEAVKQADRFNEGKLKWALVDFDSLEEMVKVLEFGAKKYGSDNWKKGLNTTEIVESLLRHITAYLNCEDTDKESGMLHVGHIMCNAMFLSYMNKYKPEFDSRKFDSNKLK